MNLLAKIKEYILLIAIGISFILGCALSSWWYSSKIEKIEDASRETSLAWEKKLNKVKDEASKQELQLKTANANANDAVKRLQRLVQNRNTSTASNYTITLGVVFNECTERRREVAEDAQRCDIERQKLYNGWPK